MAQVVTLPYDGIATVPEDGRTGILVRVHWSRWVPYFLWNPLLLAATYYAVRWCWAFHWGVGLGAALLLGSLVGKLAILNALGLLQRFLLITAANVYDSRRDALWYQVINVIPLHDNARFPTTVNGRWYTLSGTLGVFSFSVLTEGDEPETTIPYSDATQADVNACHQLTALST